MTTAQQLLEHLKDAKPSKNMERKPVKQAPPKAAAVSHREVPMCTPLTPSRVELPALGGCVEILYEDWDL